LTLMLHRYVVTRCGPPLFAFLTPLITGALSPRNAHRRPFFSFPFTFNHNGALCPSSPTRLSKPFSLRATPPDEPYPFFPPFRVFLTIVYSSPQAHLAMLLVEPPPFPSISFFIRPGRRKSYFAHPSLPPFSSHLVYRIDYKFRRELSC